MDSSRLIQRNKNLVADIMEKQVTEQRRTAQFLQYALAKRGETMTLEKERGILSVINDPRADPLMPLPFRKAGAGSKKSLRLDNSSKILLRNVYDKRGSTKSMLHQGRPSFGFSAADLAQESPHSHYNIVKTRNFGSHRSMSLAHDPSVLKIGMGNGSPSGKNLPTSPSKASGIQNEAENTESLAQIGVKLPVMKNQPHNPNTKTSEKQVSYRTLDPKSSPYLKGNQNVKLPAI